MEEEGPAFISFSGLPDENVYEFVDNVDALRKHFKWSSQITFCYARTMLKGTARKMTQGNKGSTPDQAKAGKSLGDEAIDPNSWGNLKSSLVFEFSDEFMQDRLLVQLLSIRQQIGESGSEYAQRFIGLISDLVATQSFDSSMLSMLFTNGLRSEKLRWDLLMRRISSVDRAVGYVAPDQLYRAAKLVPLLSPVGMRPPTVESMGDLSPASEASTFTAPNYIAEADALSTREVYGSSALEPGATANGASFSLDDDDDEEDEQAVGGYWTPPRLPDSRQRRLHRQSTSALPPPRQSTVPNMAMASRAYELSEHRSLSRASVTSIGSTAGSISGDVEDPKTANELNSLAEQLESLSMMLREKSDERRRRPRLCYRCRQKGHVASDCLLPADIIVPKQQAREKLAMPPSSPLVPQQPAKPPMSALGNKTVSLGRNMQRKPLVRSNTVSLTPENMAWRPSSVTVFNAIVENSRASNLQQPSSPMGGRRYTQSWGLNGGQRSLTSKQQ
ncbi:hypothetical protein GGF37_003426 [Kickxella alabastrina]|nr:hypothetical protein GGF37_003426 [Kickxella alabastrina]